MTDLRPMLASPSTGSGNRQPIDIHTLQGTHAFDVKLDGTRAFGVWDGTNFTLWNRNQINVTAKYPDLVEPAAKFYAGSQPAVLDGEIVADDGRFESALTRDKQANPAAVAAAVKRIPVHFHVFDLPSEGTRPWTERRLLLEGCILPPEFVITPISYGSNYLQQTRDLGLEGVIAKRLDATYHFGARSRAWIKFKNLHRVTCMVAGYEPGTGARAQFGAMLLALVDGGGQIVPCGRVGTGMTGAEITELKGLLDANQVVLIEVECLNVTSGNTLRMPVYKGIRTDVGVLDANTKQLETLPRS